MARVRRVVRVAETVKYNLLAEVSTPASPLEQVTAVVVG